jgi:hypothetical protein
VKSDVATLLLVVICHATGLPLRQFSATGADGPGTPLVGSETEVIGIENPRIRQSYTSTKSVRLLPFTFRTIIKSDLIQYSIKEGIALMADKNSYESQLAEAVHAAERECARANAAPAGAGRIERIVKADRDLVELQQRSDFCLSGQAGAPIKVTR